jgi:hypothetical protein
MESEEEVMMRYNVDGELDVHLETNTDEVEEDEKQGHKGECSCTSSVLFPVHTWYILKTSGLKQIILSHTFSVFNEAV